MELKHKWDVLSQGIVLVDLPGGGDANPARAAIADEYLPVRRTAAGSQDGHLIEGCDHCRKRTKFLSWPEYIDWYSLDWKTFHNLIDSNSSACNSNVRAVNQKIADDYLTSTFRHEV